MTDTTEAEAASVPRRAHPVGRFLARIPGTLALIVVILAVGVIGRGLWEPYVNSAGWGTFAYGLPALDEGRWWTPVTGTFLVDQPWVYITSFIALWGVAVLEYMRGWKVAMSYFWIGQLFAVLGAALLFWVLSYTDWQWAINGAAQLDVGFSGGAFACMAAAIGHFRAPWRARAWMVLLAYVIVALLFWGDIAELEHALAVFLVLGVDRSLKVRKATVREQRFIAFIAIIMLGVIQIVVLLVPTDGLFGETAPGEGTWWDIAIDIVVIIAIAEGLRRARRWAWVIAVALGVYNILTGGLLLAVLSVIDWRENQIDISGDPSLLLATSTLWLFMLVYLMRVRRAFRWKRKGTLGLEPVPTVDEVKELLRAHGGDTLSWMTTWAPNTYARTSTGIVAYQRRAGVALALADPIGPEEGREQSVREFIDMAMHAGLTPAFFSANDATRDAAPDSWNDLIVADDTIVDLPGLEFAGKRWATVRTSLNRAGREEMTFRMTHLKKESWGIQAQVRAISEMWVGDKGLPEMGFTLGTLTEAEDPEVRLALAVSPSGDVDGFLSWLPVYGGDGAVRGWTLDLMRRRDGGFGPVMEFLIGSSAAHFRDEGAEIVSLSGAPLTHDYPKDAGGLAQLSESLADMLEPVYGFQSLHRFKEKFNPRYETMHLVFRDEADLARIGMGLTRAFLPDASLAQLAGAGIGLMRGSGDDDR